MSLVKKPEMTEENPAAKRRNRRLSIVSRPMNALRKSRLRIPTRGSRKESRIPIFGSPSTPLPAGEE